MDKSTLEREIREIDRKLKRLYDTLLSADVSPQFITQKMVELEQQRGSLYDDLNSTNDDMIDKMRETAEKSRSRILTILKSSWTDTDEKREALEQCIDRVIVSRHSKKKLLIEVKRPLPGFGVVASKNAQLVQCPSSGRSYTGNIISEIFIIQKH